MSVTRFKSLKASKGLVCICANVIKSAVTILKNVLSVIHELLTFLSVPVLKVLTLRGDYTLLLSNFVVGITFKRIH